MSSRISPGLAITVVLLTAFGCASPQPNTTTPAGPGDEGGEAATATWPYWPAAMRIHPLTRFAHDEQADQSIIEARIEFADADGVTTRAIGRLTLTLLTPNTEPAAAPIRQWQDIDLSSGAINAQRFDTVTRTYLLKLQVDPSKLPAQCELKAVFTSSDGQTYSAMRTLQTPKQKTE